MAAMRRQRVDASRVDAASRVVDLDRRRIERALAGRTRYRYVHPRVEAVGDGWKILSPNCSRQIDPAGGEIDIAWLEAADDGSRTWHLHSKDHAAGRWLCQAEGLTLAQALDRLCRDPLGIFWP